MEACPVCKTHIWGELRERVGGQQPDKRQSGRRAKEACGPQLPVPTEANVGTKAERPQR